MTEYTEAEADAIGAANDLARSFEKRDWTTTTPVLAAGYAGVRIVKEGHEPVQAFFAVDPDTHQDRYLYGAFTMSEDMLPAIAEAPDREAVHKILNVKDKPKRKRKAVPPIVPPTSAAHMQDEAVPPIDAAHMPPIEDSHPVADAAHPWDDSNHDVMADLADAAHNSAERAAHPVFTASHDDIDALVPPTEDELEYSVQRDGAAHMRPLLDAAHLDDDEQRVAKEHIKQAGDDYAQGMTYAAVKDQLSSRLWSPVASELSDDVLIKKVVGKEITWRNSVSGKRDSAVVSRDAVKHAAKITRSSLAERPGSTEDLRILHFLEAGGGFRSVAVARIVAIG